MFLLYGYSMTLSEIQSLLKKDDYSEDLFAVVALNLLSDQIKRRLAELENQLICVEDVSPNFTAEK
jgi:hypothetical protein